MAPTIADEQHPATGAQDDTTSTERKDRMSATTATEPQVDDSRTANRNADETIDSQGAADLLHCDAGTVQTLARRGELPGLKFGRDWLFVRADLLAYLAQRGRDEAEQRRRQREIPPLHPAVGLPVSPGRKRRRTPPTLPALMP